MKTPKQPKPASLAPGHNPDNLTRSQVGKGWRLLTTKEHKERLKHDDLLPEIESWESGGWDSTGWNGSTPTHSYRTRKPAGYFLPKTVKPASPTQRKGAGKFNDDTHPWTVKISNGFCEYEYRFVGESNTSVHLVSEAIRAHLKAPYVEGIQLPFTRSASLGDSPQPAQRRGKE